VLQAASGRPTAAAAAHSASSGNDDNTAAAPAAAGGGGCLFIVPAHTKHHTFSDVPVLIETSRAGRSLLSVMGFKRDAGPSAESAIRLICECVARFCREHYAGAGPWPSDAAVTAAPGDGGVAAGGGAGVGVSHAGDAGGGATEARAEAAGGKGRLDRLRAAADDDDNVSEGIVTDEAGELAAEAHVGEHPHHHHKQQQQQQQQAAVLTSRRPHPAPAIAAAAGVDGCLPAAVHVPVLEKELDSYRSFFEEGLFKKLEVYELGGVQSRL